MPQTNTQRDKEHGFILITTLVILLVLTILGVGLYFRSTVNQQTSTVTRDTTQAYYFAETALNYVAWSLNTTQDNDAELDGNNPNPPAQPAGDRAELREDISNPGRILYMDNRPTPARAVVFNAGGALPTPVLPALPPSYLHLEIAQNGIVTPSMNSLPTNGAVLWLTPVEDGAGAFTIGSDIEVTGERDYDVAAYAVGYVNGRPMRMLRAMVGNAGFGPPIGLGSVTNGFK